jgi:hypothetical protein
MENLQCFINFFFEGHEQKLYPNIYVAFADYFWRILQKNLCWSRGDFHEVNPFMAKCFPVDMPIVCYKLLTQAVRVLDTHFKGTMTRDF